MLMVELVVRLLMTLVINDIGGVGKINIYGTSDITATLSGTASYESNSKGKPIEGKWSMHKGNTKFVLERGIYADGSFSSGGSSGNSLGIFVNGDINKSIIISNCPSLFTSRTHVSSGSPKISNQNNNNIELKVA